MILHRNVPFLHDKQLNKHNMMPKLEEPSFPFLFLWLEGFALHCATGAKYISHKKKNLYTNYVSTCIYVSNIYWNAMWKPINDSLYSFIFFYQKSRYIFFPLSILISTNVAYNVTLFKNGDSFFVSPSPSPRLSFFFDQCEISQRFFITRNLRELGTMSKNFWNIVAPGEQMLHDSTPH